MNLLKPFNILLLSFFLFLLSGCESSQISNDGIAQPDKALPNIVLILADDLGYGDVSFLNPASKIKTPHLDNLASEGMSFTDAHSNSAVCTPTRYGLMTGRYAWRSALKKGVLNGYSTPLIEEGRETIASLLKSQGYSTAMVGKWHLGLEWVAKEGQLITNKKPVRGGALAGHAVDFTQKVRSGINEQGFDYSFAIAASADMPPYVYLENGKATELPTLEKNWNIPNAGNNGRHGVMAPSWKITELMPTFADKAEGWIKAQAGNKPFFLYVPLNSPHTPVAPSDDFIGRSDIGSYGDFMMETDYTIGRVIQAVKDAGVEDNTIIIVTSDNGPEIIMYERIEEYGHNSSGLLRGAKRDSWEGGHRVPFIVKWPGVVKAGSVSEDLVGTTDFMATFADISGVSLPSTAGEDSVSFLPALTGKNGLREAIIHHSASGGFSIRQGDWKYIDGPGSNKGNNYARSRFKAGNSNLPDGSPVQLYNMREDLSETNNLYRQYPDKVQALKALLEQYKKADRSN